MECQWCGIEARGAIRYSIQVEHLPDEVVKQTRYWRHIICPNCLVENKIEIILADMPKIVGKVIAPL